MTICTKSLACMCFILCGINLTAQSQNNVSNLTVGTSFESENWLRFEPSLGLSAATITTDYKKDLGLRPSDGLVLTETKTDKLGFTHHDFQQEYKGIPVEFAVYKIHEQGGVAIKGNGKLESDVAVNTSISISEQEAFEIALACIGADSYYWEHPHFEAAKQNATDNPSATFFPTAELLIADQDFNPKNTANYHLVWKFEIFSAHPDGRFWVYVDAQSGEIVKELNLEMDGDHNGVAETRYHGTQNITTDSTENGYVLRDYTRGKGIETYDALNNTDLDSVGDFTNDDNYWDLANERGDDGATDAHWSAEQFYDYLKIVHDRKSYDNLDSKLLLYVHYDSNWYNASWGGFWTRYGTIDGNPFTNLGIVAHEFAHGITGKTGSLIYERESGAMNESFSDIMAASVWYWVTDTTQWYLFLGNDTIRSMNDPKLFGDPNTYEGENWHPQDDDFDRYGVHINSGVQNYWFYLLAEGGSGENDHGNAYQVESIGIEKAEQIIMRCMTTYFHHTSDYVDARQGTLFAAEDIYGSCSFEYQQVANAWHAVGVGPRVESLDFTVEVMDNYDVCGLNETNPITLIVTYMGCDTTGPISLDLKVTKTNPLKIVTKTIESMIGLAPGESFEYTFEEDFNFSRNGEQTLRAEVEHPDDPFEENNTSEILIVNNPASVSDQLFSFYTNFGLRTFRDSMAFYDSDFASSNVLNSVGFDSTAGIQIEGSRMQYAVGIPEGDDLFNHNKDYGTEMLFCVDATDFDTLKLDFDLRQTYSNKFEETVGYPQPKTSALRVKVNDAEIARFFPETNEDDPWSTQSINLDDYVGTEFVLSFETRTIQITSDTIDDRVFLDNIELIGGEIESSLPTLDYVNQLSVYPNPATDNLNIAFSLDNASDLSIELFSLLGQSVNQIARQSYSIGSHNLDMNVEGIPSGVYYLRIDNGEAQITKKVSILTE